MECKICKNNTQHIFDGKILNKYKAKYFHCKNCGFLFVENPFWLNEAYKNAINDTDTGVLARNIKLSKKIGVFLFFFFGKNYYYLDLAGGYGIFTRLMRDIGFNFCWQDKYSKNLFAQGFEYKESGEIELITLIECFEHFTNPIEEIDKIFKMSPNLLFTTETLPTLPPQPNQWWYYGLEHGQHISFYQQKTLSFLAKKFNKYYFSYNNIHVFTDKKINPFYIKLIFKSQKFLYYFVEKNMKSKTFEDMIYLKKEYDQNKIR
jgi:hypothetical protein